MSEIAAMLNSEPSGYPIERTVVKCPTDLLRGLLSAIDPESTVYKTFQVFNETQGIRCDNYLPWEDSFQGITGYVDGMKLNDLFKPAMWGIDGRKCLLIALKSTCQEANGATGSGVIVLYQRFKPTLPYIWRKDVERERFREVMYTGRSTYECNLGSLDLNKPSVPPHFYKDFRSILQYEKLETVGFLGKSGSLRLKI